MATQESLVCAVLLNFPSGVFCTSLSGAPCRNDDILATTSPETCSQMFFQGRCLFRYGHSIDTAVKRTKRVTSKGREQQKVKSTRKKRINLRNEGLHISLLRQMSLCSPPNPHKTADPISNECSMAEAR